MFDRKQFLDDVARASEGDYATAFKMLGFVQYVSAVGAEAFLSGELVSPRTYYRWVETIRPAGWGSLLSDVRFSQALQEYVSGLNAGAEESRQAVLGMLEATLAAQIGLDRLRSPWWGRHAGGEQQHNTRPAGASLAAVPAGHDTTGDGSYGKYEVSWFWYGRQCPWDSRNSGAAEAGGPGVTAGL